MDKKIKVLVVEDHHIMRRALIRMMNDFQQLQVVGEASNGKELLGLLKSLSPDIVLLDIEMPVMNGWETLEKVVLRYPDIHVIMLSQHHDVETMLHFISKGAKAYLPKNCEENLFIETLLAVYEKGFYVRDEVTRALIHSNSKPQEASFSKTSISTRELQVLKEIGNGLTDPKIAAKLNITKHTVHSHRISLLLKTKTHNAAELVKYAVKQGLI